MQKKPVPFGEWRPDIALTDSDFASLVENVFAGVNSYKPFPGLLPFANTPLSDSNDNFTKILLQFPGADGSTTFTDNNVGGSAHTWTASGNAQIDTAEKKFDTGSGLFQGSIDLDTTNPAIPGDDLLDSAAPSLDDTAGDYISTPDHADFTLGTADFTLDFQFNTTLTTDFTYYWMGQADSQLTPAGTSIVVSRIATNVMQVLVSTGTDFVTVTGTTPFTNLLNTGWHHFAFVRRASTFTLYLDGIREGSAIYNGAVNDASQPWGIGGAGSTVMPRYAGWLDEVRLSVGRARWDGDFIPPTAPYFDTHGVACGLTAARTSNGDWKIYAGTRGALFLWTAAGWTNVSRVSGGAYNVPPDALWSFAQFGTKLHAVNVNDDVQVIDIDAGTNFAALGGSPPRATNVYQLGDFLFLSGLASNKRKIMWSGINDTTTWTIGINLCDEQEFPDNGPVMGVSGGEIGYVLQDRGIRTIQFLPGDTTFIFNFQRILHDRGCISRYGFISIGNVLYFVAEDGFYAIAAQQVTTIGADKVNDWFLANSDIDRRDQIQAFSFVNKPRIAWAFHSTPTSTTYDRLIIYDWSNQRWTAVIEQAQVWATLASVGLDLDTTGAAPGDIDLDSTALGLDSFAYVGGRPLIGAIDENGFLSSLSGPNLKATLETAEAHLVPGMRTFVSDAYPLVDGSAETVAAGTRERLQDPIVWETPAPLEITGSAAVYSSARLHRFRVVVPEGNAWTHAQGVVVEAQQDGTVA